jgi:pimeloyl-ACP methyl ester carboxylesterase
MMSRRMIVAGMGALATGIRPLSASARSPREAGAVAVEASGGSGPALLLIPGLAGGPWCWAETIRRLSPDFAIHAVTLPGFDGRPAVEAPLIERVCTDIVRYIEESGLDRPILVGHSLGAFLALRIGVRRPERIGGIVTLDGYPVFPPLAAAGAAERAAVARRRAEPFFAAAGDPARFHALLQDFMSERMTDPREAERYAARAARSDPRATGDYVVEMLSADLRPELPRLGAPLLALAAADSYLAGRSESEIRAFYSTLLAGAPRASVLLVRQARHFIAQDQADVVVAAIEAFVAGLGYARSSGLRAVAPR